MHVVDYAAIHTVLKVDVSDISLRSERTIVSSVWHTRMIITMLYIVQCMYNAQLCTILWQLCTMLWLAHAMIITSYCYHPTAGIHTTWPSVHSTFANPYKLGLFLQPVSFPPTFPFFFPTWPGTEFCFWRKQREEVVAGGRVGEIGVCGQYFPLLPPHLFIRRVSGKVFRLYWDLLEKIFFRMTRRIPIPILHHLCGQRILFSRPGLFLDA